VIYGQRLTAINCLSHLNLIQVRATRKSQSLRDVGDMSLHEAEQKVEASPAEPPNTRISNLRVALTFDSHCHI
jgi:hypothetical protein